MQYIVKKRTIVSFISMSLIAVLLLSGCNSEAKKETSAKEVQHIGGTTTIKKTPKNVVALEFSIVDNLYQIGVKPIGIADDGDEARLIEPIRTFVKGYTSVGKRAQPNLEVIQMLEPDLIIADAKRHSEIYDQLQTIAPTILITSLEGNYEELEQSFRTISEVFGKEKVADKVILDSEERIKRIRKSLTKTSLRTKTIMPIVPEVNSINVHTSSSYIGDIIKKLGLKHSVENENVYAEFTLEQLSENKPEIMIYMRPTKGTIVDAWNKNDVYKKLPAVKNDDMVYVDPEVWSRFRGYESLKIILSDFEKMSQR